MGFLHHYRANPLCVIGITGLPDWVIQAGLPAKR